MMLKTRKLKISFVIIICLVFAMGTFFGACSSKDNLLTADDFIDAAISAPEGSGQVRTITIDFMLNNEKKSDSIDLVTWVDNAGYDDEKREQTLTASDYNQDGVFDLIVYREFWFPDIQMIHLDVPLWPVIYEYDIEKGFVIASSKYKDYFKKYAESIDEKLASEDLEEAGKQVLRRLKFAAGKVADGSFVPRSSYNESYYYEDVFELVKSITS